MDMTKRFRAAAAALLVAAAATFAVPASAAHLREVTEKVFSFAPGGALEIESQNGRIVVEAWDRPQIRVQMTREVRAPGQESGRTLMKQLTADVTVSPRRVRIVSVYPKREKVVGFWDLLGRGVRSANIHYYVQVPRGTSLDLETANGEVRVRGTQGKLVASTTNGDIDVTSVRGSADVRTTNGEIRIARLEGMADAMTTNGSVAAEITALPSTGSMELHTTNGNVQLALPRDIRAEVEANTTNGRVNINYTVTMIGSITSKSIRGTIGGGGAKIRLETTNGNIDVGPPRRPRQ
jgi:putative adhesin